MSLAVQAKPIDCIRVMVVDDSAVIRGLITKMLNAEPDIEVVASVANGLLAVKNLIKSNVDVLVLDIEMPVMDGLTALPKLLEQDRDLKVIMASTLTMRNADVSLKALQAGAADYVAKPSSTHEITAADDFRRELVSRVRALGETRKGRHARPSADAVAARPATAAAAAARPGGRISLRDPGNHRPTILAIGSSTGGPQALFALLKSLSPSQIKQPVIITQHMPATFTTILAEHITRQTDWTCNEAKDGEVIEGKGHIYLAPGGYHLLVEKKGENRVIRLSKGEPENYCRPAVDPMLRSAVESYGPGVLSVILTGMGADGMKGGEKVVNAGGTVVAQDEKSSVVWGMPGAVASAGLCSAVLPINRIGAYVAKMAQ